MYLAIILSDNNLAMGRYIVVTKAFLDFMLNIKFCLVTNVLWLFVLRFIVDCMLGKLTRWLRILGHDVSYYRIADDRKLIDLAESEKRILLTCDIELYQQAITQGFEADIIEAPDIDGKLAALAKRFDFKLEVDLNISRCPKCNVNLVAVSKEEIIDVIPKATSTNYSDFWRCLGCGQKYWQGAHWKRIRLTLNSAKRRLLLL